MEASWTLYSKKHKDLKRTLPQTFPDIEVKPKCSQHLAIYNLYLLYSDRKQKIFFQLCHIFLTVSWPEDQI